MKIVIDSTEEIVVMDGVSVRAWQGVTARGVRCLVMVHRIIIPSGETEEFETGGVARTSPPDDVAMLVPCEPYEDVGPFPAWD